MRKLSPPWKQWSRFASVVQQPLLPLLLLALLFITEPMTSVYSAELHPAEIAALRSIRSNLQDMPGSSFFASWDFDLDPCHSFAGVACDLIQGEKRVTQLNLGTVYAGAPGLTGKLPSSIADLSFLRQLTISPGEVGGEIPEGLGQHLSAIQFLGISRNRLSGVIPESFAGLVNLEFLDLSHNELTGSIPRELGELPKLFSLTLSDNRLTGAMPAISSEVTHLDLARNNLRGGLPPLSRSLRYLSVQGNDMQGALKNLIPLQSLSYVDLSFNGFIGTVPKELFNLPLLGLHLQHNQLSGSIVPSAPVRIGTIDLSYNRLSGELSPFLTTARVLYLNNNRFSGAVPLAFVDSLIAASLQILFLQHNYLTSFGISSDLSLPPQSSLCIQYNCMLSPKQSTCPLRSGKLNSRPRYECLL